MGRRRMLSIGLSISDYVGGVPTWPPVSAWTHRKFSLCPAFRPTMELREPAVAPNIEIHERRDPDRTLVLSVCGDIDFGTAPELAERLTGATSHLWSLVLDLNAVEFMDSSGLSVLLAVTNRAREDGCSVSLARPHDGLLRLVRLTGLDAALPLRPEVRGSSRSRGCRLLTWVAGDH